MIRELVTALAVTAVSVSPLLGQVDVREWTVPWAQSRPRDPYVAPDGRVWFVGQRTHYVAALDPESGVFQRFDLDDGTGPHNLIVDADGMVWYAGNRAQHIGILNPETGQITKIATPEGVTDPHTLVFDGRGNIWFTAQQSNYVGVINMASREIRVAPVPTPRARPYGIVLHDGQPWIVLFGTNKLATVDPATMELREISLPREDARPRRLVVTSDGRVWYGDYSGGYLGRYDPRDGSFEEWPLPSGGGALPYGMALDDRGRIWLVETGPRPNQLVGFDPATEAFFGVTPIESGAGSVRHMYFHAPTRSIWFGTDANTVGRAVVP